MPRDGWAELYAWEVNRASDTPLIKQIYEQIRNVVMSRTLKPGTKLPSSRALASQLGVARASVVAAYEQLLAESVISGKTGSGTYISADLPPQLERGRARTEKNTKIPKSQVLHEGDSDDERPFTGGRTLMDARSIETWRKLMQRAFRPFAAHHLGYGDPQGFLSLRTAICDYLRAARGVRCEPAQIIITAGTQHAVDIVIRLLIRPGDVVWVENPGYAMTASALRAANAMLCPVPVDASGIKVDAGIEAAPRAKAVFVTPSHQYPTGVVLTMARRLALLDWAKQSGAWVIEDDYQSEIRYSGPPLASLQGLDQTERTIYIGTLNKALFPGLRMGYLVAPPRILKSLINVRELMDRQPPTLLQDAVTAFLTEGHLAAHIRRTRLMYRVQRDVLAAELNKRLKDHLTVDVPDQGMNLAAYLRPGLSDVAIEKAAQEKGVIVRAMSRLYVGKPKQALIMGFSGHTPQKIIPAVAKLAEVVRAVARNGAAT